MRRGTLDKTIPFYGNKAKSTYPSYSVLEYQLEYESLHLFLKKAPPFPIRHDGNHEAYFKHSKKKNLTNIIKSAFDLASCIDKGH